MSDIPLIVPPGRQASPHFTAESDEWETPDWLYDALNLEFGFTLDPCATAENAKCPLYFTKEHNGLKQDWSGKVVFMNPPYGREIGPWMAKAHGAATHEGATVVCLLPARTDTSWWHDYAMRHEIRFYRGRLTFKGAKHNAPFPSVVVVMRPARFSLGAF